MNKYHAGSVIVSFDDESYLKSIVTPNQIDIDKMKDGASNFYGLEEGVEKYAFVYKQVYVE